MKKLALAVVAIFVFSGAFAQDQNKPVWGIKGGLNIARETANNDNTDTRAGIHAGLFTEVKVSNLIDFQPELLYSMQGGSYDGITDKIDYINVPLILKFYVNQNRRFSIDAGLQFGYMVSAKVSDGEYSVSIYDGFEDVNGNRVNMNKFDVALALGISYKLNDRFDIGLRGTEGFTEMAKGATLKNSVSQIAFGYRF